jgi:hypothetical protein
MKLRTLMTVSALVACPYGLMCLILPEFFLSRFGFTLAGHGLLMARMYGGQVFGIGLISYLARNEPNSSARRSIIWGFVVLDTVSLGIAVYAQVTQILGPAGYVDVIGFFGFAAAFTYFAIFPERAD